jgi:DNA-binding ferritin-like protein (Dps family)
VREPAWSAPGVEGQDRAARYRAIALRAVAALSAGDRRPKTLHRLRTHLRRLQAYLELVGEEDNADRVARCVSRFSRLRTLQVFEQYLGRVKSSKRDRRLVRARIRKLQAKLRQKQTYRQVRYALEHHALPPTPTSADWMGQRMAALRRTHADRLGKMIAQAQANPRRKTLHGLRLMIKAIRYQEEWALGQRYARPDLVTWLKKAQKVLGDYEERAQFRKLAEKWELESQDPIERDWRQARKRARGLPHHLNERVRALQSGHLQLLQGGQGLRRKTSG